MDASGSARPGPLVAPGPVLDADSAARARRQITLPGFGELAQRRLSAARVLVIGAGGLGSAIVPYLAGAGVGRIGIIDDDTVELSNLHRQIAHGTADIGRGKVDSIAETVAALTPHTVVDRHTVRLSAANALALFGDYDLVIDGSDNFPTRFLANDAAELSGIPLVWGAILQYSGQVGVAWHAHGAGYRDLFPVPPDASEVLDCATGGVLPGLCGTVGSLLATEAMKLITGIGDPLIGRVLVYDALAARTRELRVNRDPLGSPITELRDAELPCAADGTSAPDTEEIPDPAAAQDPAAPATLDGAELRARIAAGPVRLIDVRTPEEYAERRVRGSESLPLDRIEAGAVVTGPVVLYCERDPRSFRAAAALCGRGTTEVTILRGGIDAFARLAPDLIERGS